jgi:hypothetical protein
VKKRIVIFVEEEVIGQARRFAVKEGRSLSEIIGDALVFHLNQKAREPGKRKHAYQLFCERPMRLTRNQFNEILKEENFKPL